MLPRWHILYGALFSIILYFFLPDPNIFYLVLVFLSSFLIDFDHYASIALKTKNLGLHDNFEMHRKRLEQQKRDLKNKVYRKGPDFHLFHTIEFHLAVFFLGFIWTPFSYIFIGMFFHSMLDLISMAPAGVCHRRYYFLVEYLFYRSKRS